MGFKVFIDSDVVIDFFTDREPHANPASELFELNEKGDVVLYLSAVSINNIYYIVRWNPNPQRHKHRHFF